MTTLTITAQRMLTAGVSIDDARWYFTVARPRGFRAPGDVIRAKEILHKTLQGNP